MVEALVGEQKINRVYCLRAQPTAQAPRENTKQEIEIPRETKSDTITYTQINTPHTEDQGGWSSRISLSSTAKKLDQEQN